MGVLHGKLSPNRKVDGFVFAWADCFDLPPRAALRVGWAGTVGLDEDGCPLVEESGCVVAVVIVIVVLVVEYVVAYVVSLFVVFTCNPLDGVGCRGEVDAFHGVPCVDTV